MSFLGIYVFVGIDSESTGMTACEEQYYEECNLADLWVQGSGFSLDSLTYVKSVPGMKQAERRLQVDGKAIVRDKTSGEEEVSMQMNFVESNEISKLYLLEGEPYKAGRGGVYLDYFFSEKRGYKVGDTITLKLESTRFDVKVAGIFHNPEYVYYLEDVAAMMPDYGAYGFCFLDESEYPFEEIIYNQIIVDAEKIDNTAQVSDTEKEIQSQLAAQIKDVLDDQSIVVTGKDDQLSYQTYRSEMAQHKSMAFAFPIVFVLISLLGIITTMTRLMAKQRVQIGTMKALGFSTADVVMHYISYGFVLSLAGCVLGAVVGYYTLPDFIISMFVGSYILPYMHKGLSLMSLSMIAMMVSVSTLITFVACRKECALIPAQALRPAAPKVMKTSFVERSRVWKLLSFSTQWNLRDIIRNKMRTLMGIVGVVGCSMLLFSAFGCLDSIDHITTWMYGELNTAKNRIVLAEDIDYGTASDYAKQYGGQMIQSVAISLSPDEGVSSGISAGSASMGTSASTGSSASMGTSASTGSSASMGGGVISKTGTLTVLDRGNFMHYEDADMEHITLDKNEIAMTYKMAESLGVKEGSLVCWHVLGDDKIHKFRVGQIYRNPSVQGITMYREPYEKLNYKFVPTEILTNMTVPSSLADKDEIIGVQNTNAMMDSLKSMMEMMYTMAGILIAAAIILGVVVLYNLGVLSMVEKRREMATLKVLGYATSGVRAILAQQNTWITLIGIVLGFPAGFGILGVLFNDMPESMDYSIVVYPKTYLYTFVLTFLISWAVNRVMSREVKFIDMVEALKGQE